MDNKIKIYRTRHKKCKGCKYYKLHTYSECHYCCSYATCELKDKIINLKNIDRICKGYELKGDKDEN